jgi:magnesium-transporting ATPase (P-type)
LFTQVAYYQVFYPATILMAWPWLGIIPLLTLAYYGVYIYAAGFRLGGPGPTRFKQSAGWVSALLFLAIGFIFTSAFALMTNISAWPALWQQTSVAGAPLGIAHSLANPTLWPRWLLMLGLALTTTAAYVVVDTGWFAQKESGAYKQWTARFGLEVYSAGVVLFVVAGVAYVFGGWPAELRQLLFTNPVFMLAAISAGLPWLLILAQVRQGAITQGLAMATGLGQSGVLALNAISRQLAQNAELEKYLDVTGQPVQVDWSPMILFLVLFAAGLALVIWMVRKVLIAVRGPEP